MSPHDDARDRELIASSKPSCSRRAHGSRVVDDIATNVSIDDPHNRSDGIVDDWKIESIDGANCQRSSTVPIIAASKNKPGGSMTAPWGTRRAGEQLT